MRRPSAKDRPTADKIVDAAMPLFYQRGFAPVTLDEVAEKADVTKRTLYYHFATKSDLIFAYLERLQSRTRAEYAASSNLTGSAGVLAAFTRLADEIERSKFRGCPIANAVAEINDRSDPAIILALAYKEERRAWFEQLLAAIPVRNPRKLSEQIMDLWEGSMARSAIIASALPVHEARDAAATLIDAERRARPAKR